MRLPVGRLCQAAPYFALRATKGKRGAESKGAAHWPGLWQERQTPAGSSISSDVRMSEPLGGALVRNIHAEFPRLSRIGCSELMILKTGMV
jgi:hypothetical protein